jgi:hypothetical protein
MTDQPNVPIFQVAQLLDKDTVVITGPSVGELNKGERLEVTSVGGKVEGAMLVVPKATLEVTLVTDKYVIARPPKIETEVGVGAIMSGLARTTRWVRPELHVDEKELAGNPAYKPVRVGDVVIRAGDLREYAKSLDPTSSI